VKEKRNRGFAAGLVVGVLVATVLFALFVRVQNGTSAGSTAGDVLTLKLAHSLDPSHPVHVGMEHMKKRLEELSGGTVTLDIYPSGVLGSETQCVEQTQNGALAMTKTSASPLEGFIPEMGVFSLPYVFRDRDHFWKVLDSDLGKELLLRGVHKNVRGLTYYDSGSRNFYTKEKPVLTPADIQGMKIRVMNSKTAMAMITAMGGAPTPIAWGELYTSLQQGVVDGAENNPPSFYTNRHHEVCKFLSMDGHTRIPDILLINENIWNALPNRVQQWVQQAADESSLFQRELWQVKTNEALEEVQKEGVQVFYPDQGPFVETVKPLLESYRDTPTGDLLEQIRSVK